MNVRDLRIGNLVWNHIQKIPVEVDLKIISDQYYADKGLKEGWEPIPLTEEWLCKFGFKHSGNGFYDLIGKHLSLANISNEFFHMGFKGKSIREIYYVHQLQNLHHSLTGKELEYAN